MVDPGEFKWTAGENLLKAYLNKEGVGLLFCSECGSTLCGIVDGKVHGVALGCVNGDPGIKIEKHIFVGSKALWEVMPDNVIAYEEGPPNELS